MSLYDDILPDGEIKLDKDSNKTKTWSNSSMNLLQHHLQNRKQQPKPNQFKPRQTICKPTKPSVPVITSQQIFTPSKHTGSLLGGDWNVNLEYDPFWPNDYEKIVKERKEKANVQVVTQTKISTFTAPTNTPVLTLGARPLVDAYSDDDEDDEEEAKKSKGGVSIAPPSFLTESTPSNTTVTNANQPHFNSVSPPSDTNALNMNVSGVAAKIMAKMGYKEGKGLGKNQQGIATALQVEKTSKNSGVIISNTSVVTNMNKDEFAAPIQLAPVNNQQTADQSQSSNYPSQESITEMMKNPTRVIMLRNMVGDEVDPDLIPE